MSAPFHDHEGYDSQYPEWDAHRSWAISLRKELSSASSKLPIGISSGGGDTSTGPQAATSPKTKTKTKRRFAPPALTDSARFNTLITTYHLEVYAKSQPIFFRTFKGYST